MNNTIKKILLYIAIIVTSNFIAYNLLHIPTRILFVSIISMIIFYPIIRKPIIGVYLSFIILPFIPFIRRLYYLVYERPKIDPIIILGDIILTFILVGLIFEFKEKSKENEKIKPFIRIILFYFFYLIFRTFAFNYLSLKDALLKFKLYGPAVLYFFIGIIFANNLKHLKRFWLITVILGTIASLYGYKQLIIGYSLPEKLWFRSINFTTMFINGTARPFSFFQAPVAFADYMQISIIGILIIFGWMRSKLKYLILPLLILMFYSSLTTSVRSSWVGIILTFLLWFIFFRARNPWKRWIILIIFSLLYFTFELFKSSIGIGLGLDSFFKLVSMAGPNSNYVNDLIFNRASALYNPLTEHSFLSRLSLWRIIIINAMEPINAFVGRGLGTLKSDSLYFTYLAEFGYPGVIFIISLIISFIFTGMKIFDMSNNQDIIILAKGIVILDIVFAVISITGTHIHYFPGDMFFWFWNGVLIKLSVPFIQPSNKNNDKITSNT